MGDEPFVPTFVRGLPLARAAVIYAAQLRQSEDTAVHPLEVAALLYVAGYPETVVTAGVLHDTVEDDHADPAELRERFGDEVADLVVALTEDPRIEPFSERKAALRQQVGEFGASATAVYAADKIAKVRELRAHAAHDRSALTSDHGRARAEHYQQSLAMLEQRDADHPFVRLLRFEIEALLTARS
jgi:(p)ppGpp synthase/HD superfamily hydrolase